MEAIHRTYGRQEDPAQAIPSLLYHGTESKLQMPQLKVKALLTLTTSQYHSWDKHVYLIVIVRFFKGRN